MAKKTATKGRGKVAEIDVPIVCAGVRLESGDLIFGDVDGVVVVPRKVEKDVLARAFAKVSSESATRDELLRGQRRIFTNRSSAACRGG